MIIHCESPDICDMASVQFGISEKGRDLIVVDNFKFRYYKLLVVWNDVILQLPDDHNHEALSENV